MKKDVILTWSKAYMSQINLQHGTTTNSGETESKNGYAQIIGKQSGESVESVQEKKKVGYGGKDLQKRKVLSLEWKSKGVMDDERWWERLADLNLSVVQNWSRRHGALTCPSVCARVPGGGFLPPACRRLLAYCSAPDRAAEYCVECVCVFVCPRSYLRNDTPDLHQTSCAFYMWPCLGRPLAA